MRITTLSLLLLTCLAFFTFEETKAENHKLQDSTNTFFEKAVPVWGKNLQYEKNITIGFRGVFEIKDIRETSLKITGSSLYRIYLNGQFIGHGPARAAHGYYRVDSWELTDKLASGTNIIAIEAVGYNVNSYYLLDQPSFLQAEVVSGEDVLLATGEKRNGFLSTRIEERIQKVPRYSFQRPFIECYNLSPESYNWRTDLSSPIKELPLENTSSKQLLSRGVKYPDFAKLKPIQIHSSGEIKTSQKVRRLWSDRAVKNIGEKLKGFPEKELAINPAIDLQEMKSINPTILREKYNPASALIFSKDSYKIFDFGHNTTGFIGANITCKKPGQLYFVFDELLSNEDVNFKRLSCINAVTYDLKPGTYSVESFEPYTFKYLKIIMVGGESEIENIYLREIANSDISRAAFSSSDEKLNLIYDAGVETFKQNAVDIFMDCPSRERAGWLCDSYFTARVAADISGNTLIEKNLFENFLLPEKFNHIPDGMLPMCYPADHNDGVFIPNWAMWFVVQLEEYLKRSNDKELVEALKPKVLQLFNYFDKYTNKDGLLEKLDSWVFVEWSKANKFVQDVNYPTNMLYSAALKAASNMYNMPGLSNKAESIRNKIREQSFNGQFFIDNAIRKKNGELERTTNISEVCQYYAFYFNIATPKTYGKLWNNLVNHFGPHRKTDNKYPKVHFANSFPGNYLRLELLSKDKKASQILDESIGFFSYMAERTGTLWEHKQPTASCNHGFASHTIHFLYRDVLGINDINIIEKKITLQFSDLELSSCKGQIPIGDEIVALEWKKEGNTISYKVTTPHDYKIEIINLSGLKLIEQ
jgi:alpha-L-rhamnosidase